MIVLFDGVCVMCNWCVQFVVARDPQERVQFASLHSQFAREVIEKFHVPLDLDSIIVIDDGHLYTHSSGALKVLSQLSMPWPLLYFLLYFLVPRFVRDFCYHFVARNRYSWFGEMDSCRKPSPQLRSRFLDADEQSPPDLELRRQAASGGK